MESVCARSDYGDGNWRRAVRRSASAVGLTELHDVSQQPDAAAEQANRHLPTFWEQELLKMKLVSSSFGQSSRARTSSTGSDKDLEQNGGGVSPQLINTSLTETLARLSPGLSAGQEVAALVLPDLPDQGVAAKEPQPVASGLRSEEQQFEGVFRTRSAIPSPFLAAAQKFCSAAPPQLGVHEAQDGEACSDPEGSPESDAGPSSKPPALIASTEGQELVMLDMESLAYHPDDRFSLDSRELQHSLRSPPFSPQSTAERFLTADSFQNEPGQTLFDCTEPTPHQSVDLDDSSFRARLAPFLPTLTSTSGRRVQRQLSSQFASWSTARSRKVHLQEPDPSAIATADAELGVIDEGRSARPSSTGHGDRGLSLPSSGVAECNSPAGECTASVPETPQHTFHNTLL